MPPRKSSLSYYSRSRIREIRAEFGLELALCIDTSEPTPAPDPNYWDGECLKAMMENSTVKPTLEGSTNSVDFSTWAYCDTRRLETQSLRTRRATPRHQQPHATTTAIGGSHSQCVIDQGVGLLRALAERDATEAEMAITSHGSGNVEERQACLHTEMAHTQTLECQPMNFKGIEGVVGLTQ
ncbi:hypothetical protein Tco_1112968 [Tanacetum coccineum]|uniref:Uncharacterized protein n=1 Tax=Tanacetum coccineum TaxID=301880 RepID=A0ABQ5ISB4_9ASTR